MGVHPLCNEAERASALASQCAADPREGHRPVSRDLDPTSPWAHRRTRNRRREGAADARARAGHLAAASTIGTLCVRLKRLRRPEDRALHAVLVAGEPTRFAERITPTLPDP